MQLYFHKRCLSSRSSHFRFWFLVTFGDEVMKIQKYYVIFVYILQGKVCKMEKRDYTKKTKIGDVRNITFIKIMQEVMKN